MTTTCPECGAVLNNDQTCQSIFDSFLVLEFTDPAYGEVHMLTVSCFMLQHKRYSDPALGWIEEKIRLVLDAGQDGQQVTRRMAKETSQAQRTWKVLRQPGDPPLPDIAWSMTIADVAARYTDAESYCTLIRQWARVTIDEMKPWLSG